MSYQLQVYYSSGNSYICQIQSISWKFATASVEAYDLQATSRPFLSLYNICSHAGRGFIIFYISIKSTNSKQFFINELQTKTRPRMTRALLMIEQDTARLLSYPNMLRFGDLQSKMFCLMERSRKLRRQNVFLTFLNGPLSRT